MATFNEFQRELIKRNIDPQNAYMLTLVYERMMHMAKEIEEQSKLILGLANSLSGLVELHEQTGKQVKNLARGLRPDGVELHSVANDPDEEKKH